MFSNPLPLLLPGTSRVYDYLRCVFTCLVVGSAACSTVPEKAANLVGRPSPDARLMMLDGTETTLSAQQGRYVALLFWATWCRYSKGAIEDFEELARSYRRRSNVLFFAVSVDRNEDFENLKSRIVSQELESIVHMFSGNDVLDEAYQKFFGELVPMAVLIDPRGVVRYVGTDVSGVEDLLDERFGR